MKTHRLHPQTYAPGGLLLATAILVGTITSHAAVSNLGNATTGSTIPDYITYGKDHVGHNVASSFTVGSNDLTFFTITANFANGSNGGFNAYVYDNSGPSGMPGSTPVMTLAGNNAPANGLFVYTFSSGNSSLTPGATYWAVFTVDQSGSDKFATVNTVSDLSETGDTVTGWSIGNTYIYQAVTNGTSGVWNNSGSSTPLQFAVNTVPEPSGIALFASGIGPLFLFRRRRNGTAA